MSDKREATPSDLALAIDIGATKMAVGLVTRRGEMVDREIIGTDRDKNANDLFGGLAILVKRHIERAAERHGGKVVVIGIGSAGPIEPDCVSVSPLNIPSWRRFPLQEAIREVVVDVPIFGDLDAKAFALAEGWLGSAKGHSNFLGMVVSTGVGGGIVLDGKLLDGASGVLTEIAVAVGRAAVSKPRRRVRRLNKLLVVRRLNRHMKLCNALVVWSALQLPVCATSLTSVWRLWVAAWL